jgi:hypothetical protein
MTISTSVKELPLTPDPPPGMVVEQMFADTGANRTVHPNPKSAYNYFPLGLNISTAAGDKSLKSEGVGIMKLYTPKGKTVSGFDRVIFCKNVSEKLLSVGEMCDAGYVFVFDDKKLVTYSKNDFNIKGKIFTTDFRDVKTKLYPITFYRKLGEKGGVIGEENDTSMSTSTCLTRPPPPPHPSALF